MGCSLGKQAKKEAEEENLVDKPAEKNEENVLFERPAATGEAQEPLLTEGAAAEVAKEAAADAKTDDTELDILKDVAKADDSLTAEVTKAMEEASGKKEEAPEPVTTESTTTVTTVTTTSVQQIGTKGDEDFVIVEKKDIISDDVQATATEVASEVIKSVTEESKTMITKEVSKVSSSTSEKTSTLSSGANESISKISGDVSEVITKYTSSASESVSKLSCSSTQEYKSVVTSSVSKFTDAEGNEIESTPIVEVKEDVVTEVKHNTEQSSKSVEDVVTDVIPAAEFAPEAEKEEEKEVTIVQTVTETVTEVAPEDNVVPAVEESISVVTTTVQESVPSSSIIPVVEEQESIVSTTISSDVDAPAVDLTETSVDSGKIIENDVTETCVDAVTELQETSVDSGAVQEAITETSVDQFPAPPAMEAEENVVEVVEKAEDIFKSEHEKQVEASQILAADLMTAEVPSALPSPKGAYEEDILLPNESVEFFQKESAEPEEEVIVTKETVVVEEAAPVDPIIEDVLDVVDDIVEEPKEEIEQIETVPVVVPEVEEVETEPEVVEVEQVETVPEVVEVEQVETVPEVVEVEQVETVPEVVEVEQVETVPEVVEVEQVETVPEVEQIETVPEVGEIEQIETEPEVVEVEQIETKPEVVEVEQVETVTEVEQVETEPEVVEIEQVETVTEVVQEAEPEEAKPETLVETLEEQVEELIEKLEQEEQEKELCEVPMEECTVESEEVVDSKVENDTMVIEASTLPASEESAAEAVTTLEETETQNVIEEEVVDVPVIENNGPTENLECEIVSNGPEQIDITGSDEQVPTTAAILVESVLDSVKSEIAAVMEELPAQKSAVLSENDLDNESNTISFSQDIQSFPNGENQVQTLEETGHDPVEGVTELEDRFYNNDSFKQGVGADDTDSAARTEVEESKDVKAEVKVDDPEEEGDDECSEARVEAACKIQAGFKGYKVRKEMKEHRTTVMKSNAATKIQAGIRGHLTRKKLKTMKGETRQDIEVAEITRAVESVEAEEAAEAAKAAETTEVAESAEAAKSAEAAESAEATKGAEAAEASEAPGDAPATTTDDKPADEDEEVIDIDLNDPEVAIAASKIQKGFRGHMSKKQTKHPTTESTEPPVETPAEPLAEPPAEPSAEKPADETDANNSSIKEDNAIDIDLSDPEVSAAATKIQANFRGHQTRQKLKDAPEQPPVELPAEPPVETPVETPAEPPAEPSVEKPAVETDVNNSSIKEDNAIDIDLTDPEVSAAATKIQANFRGHQTRQKLKDASEVTSSVADVHSEPVQKEEAETKPEEIDIDLTDPEVEAAAQKIQASFRGHMKLKRKQTISEQETQEKEAVTVEKDKEENISEVSGVQEEKENKEDVTEEKEKEEDKEEVEGVTDMKPTNQTGSVEGDKVNKTEEEKSAAASAVDKEQEVPAEMKAAAATPKATDAEGPVTPKAEVPATPKATEVEVPATPKAPETEEVDIDLGDPDVAAATKKLQAGFRGRLNRRKKAKEDAEALAASTEESSPNQTPTPTPQTPTPVEVESTAAKSNEIDDIDLNDPELAAAALKIQSSFRGHISRKSVKKTEEDDVDPASEEAMSQKSNSATPVQDAAGDQGQKDDKSINYEDPQVHLAATKIQAGFKGYQTRKSLKKQAGSSEDLEKDGGS